MADLDNGIYRISDFFNPRALAFAPGSQAGSGFLYVLNGSSSTGGSGLTRMRVEPSGPVGAQGTQVQVGAPETAATVVFADALFNAPSGLSRDPDSGLLYVVNYNDSNVLEIDFEDRPQVVRVFQTGLGPERLTAVQVGNRNGRRGLFLADTGGDSNDGGGQGRLLFFPLP